MRFSSLVLSMNKTFFQKLHYSTTWTHIRLYCVELLLVKYYLFYLCCQCTLPSREICYFSKLKPKFCNFFFRIKTFFSTKYPKHVNVYLNTDKISLFYKKKDIQAEKLKKRNPDLQWIVLLGDIRKRDETRPKAATRAEDNFIRVTSLRDRSLTAPNITAQLNQCCEKKASTSTVKIFWESGIYGKIAVKKPLLRNQNNVKRLQCVKAHKDWTIQQCNKVLWTDESKFEIFGSHRSVYVRRRVGERAATPCIPPTVKHRKSSVIVWGGYCQLQSRSFAPGEG